MHAQAIEFGRRRWTDAESVGHGGRSRERRQDRPAAADLHAVRPSTLFTYSGIATNDSDLIRIIAEAKASGVDPKTAIKSSGYRPNMKKRGSIRTVFDGRYKFSR